jgi:hypothetical protein
MYGSGSSTTAAQQLLPLSVQVFRLVVFSLSLHLSVSHVYAE